jgi:hypothetical protein
MGARWNYNDQLGGRDDRAQWVQYQQYNMPSYGNIKILTTIGTEVHFSDISHANLLGSLDFAVFTEQTHVSDRAPTSTQDTIHTRQHTPYIQATNITSIRCLQCSP